MTRPAWHREARRLAKAGLSSPKIAERLDVSVTSVLKAIDPAYAARQRALTNAAARRRYAENPANRAARKASAARARHPKGAPDDVFA